MTEREFWWQVKYRFALWGEPTWLWLRCKVNGIAACVSRRGL